MAVDVQPVPPEAIPGTPFRPAVFIDMSAVPYVRDGWVSYTLWAKEMHSALPAGAAVTGRSQGKAGSLASGPAQDAA
jgi:hypothetical protein